MAFLLIYKSIKKTWLAPSLSEGGCLVAFMRWPWMAECHCSQGWREGTSRKVYNCQLYFLTSITNRAHAFLTNDGNFYSHLAKKTQALDTILSLEREILCWKKEGLL